MSGQNAAVPPSAGKPCYEIEFVPTLEAAADHQVLPNLLQELSAFGEIDILAQPQPNVPRMWRLRPTTERPQDDFVDIIDFISEQDAWRVKPAAGLVEDAGGAYGLFDAPATESARTRMAFEPQVEAAAVARRKKAMASASSNLCPTLRHRPRRRLQVVKRAMVSGF